MMTLNVAIGILAAVMAVLGGIVSAHPPKELKHKRLYVASFIACGFVAVVLIIVQAVKTGKAATRAEEEQKQMLQKQSELNDKVSSESTDLADTKALLQQSRIDQAHMKGQLDALELMAGKIGQSSGTGMQALVGAINKVADSGTVGKSALQRMSNDELRAAVKKWSDAALEFDAQHMTDQERTSEQMSQEAMRATTNQEKEQGFQKMNAWMIQNMNDFETQWREKFVGDGLALREELRRRLGSPLPVMEPGGLEMPGAFDINVSTWSIKATASYLEWLSKQLP